MAGAKIYKQCGPTNNALAYKMCDRSSRKPTNADRIRSMSDEELAAFIYSQVEARCINHDCVGAGTCYYHANWDDECADGCEQAIKRWLQSEVKVES